MVRDPVDRRQDRLLGRDVGTGVRQAERDDGLRDGPAREASERVEALERKVHELHGSKPGTILKALRRKEDPKTAISGRSKGPKTSARGKVASRPAEDDEDKLGGAG